MGHVVSVALPHKQCSWISKAHLVGQITKPTYFRPGSLHQDDGTTHDRPSATGSQEEWVLINGTPATCAQLGLFHLFPDKPVIDVVVSGPNYGRNCTSLLSLSSGTIGGAMEAVVCGKKAVALSFAFDSRDHDPLIIGEACCHSVKLIEHLYDNWDHDVDLYSINVPLRQGIGNQKIMYTNLLKNSWSSGSSYQEVEIDDQKPDPGRQEQEIRKGEDPVICPITEVRTTHTHRHFKWAPIFSDVHTSIDNSPPGNDGWAVSEGYTRLATSSLFRH